MVAPRSPAASGSSHPYVVSLLPVTCCGPEMSVGTVGPELATVIVAVPEEICAAAISTSPAAQAAGTVPEIEEGWLVVPECRAVNARNGIGQPPTGVPTMYGRQTSHMGEFARFVNAV